jgi:hypothetical protein
MYDGPVIGTSKEDPYFTGTACVVPEPGGGYECYYLSCNGWAQSPDIFKLEPMYRIKRVISGNAKTWFCLPDSEGVVIDYKNPDEGGICNATVWRSSKTTKHMWYCYRNKFDYRDNSNNSYRIGYAKATWVPPTTWERGYWNWQRRDELVQLPLGDDWDSQMLAYPSVLEHDNQLFMFYNGNGFGSTGFGYCTLKAAIL